MVKAKAETKTEPAVKAEAETKWKPKVKGKAAAKEQRERKDFSKSDKYTSTREDIS